MVFKNILMQIPNTNTWCVIDVSILTERNSTNPVTTQTSTFMGCQYISGSKHPYTLIMAQIIIDSISNIVILCNKYFVLLFSDDPMQETTGKYEYCIKCDICFYYYIRRQINVYVIWKTVQWILTTRYLPTYLPTNILYRFY